MSYIAEDLKDKANTYEGIDIFQDLLMTTEFDSENSTDDSAIYSDGSALVLCYGRWEFEMFDADGDNLEEDDEIIDF